MNLLENLMQIPIAHQILQHKNLPTNLNPIVSIQQSNLLKNQSHQNQQLQHNQKQQQQNIQIKKKKSFSPLKNFKLNEAVNKINHDKNFPLEKPPLLLERFNSQQNAREKHKYKNPMTYLLQHHSKNFGGLKKRSDQQVKLIFQLIHQNSIFKDLGFEGNTGNTSRSLDLSNYNNMLKQICSSAVLLWSQMPNIAQTKSNQLFLILEGSAFEYIQNQSVRIKLKIHENNDYLMIRKLVQNDYFFTFPSVAMKNKLAQKSLEKYQLMVDQKTLMLKISDDIFTKYFQHRIFQKTRSLTNFMRKIILFQNLPSIVFQQLSKFIRVIKKNKGQSIIKFGEKSKDIFFIKKGTVQFCLEATNEEQQKKETSVQVLGQFDAFGMDTLHTIKNIQIIIDYAATSISDCELHCIDKRALAIVISSFEKQFTNNQKIMKSININSQIKGQNYLSSTQQLLTQNAVRIKTTEKKIRDVKLKSYSKKDKREVNQYIPQKDRVYEKRFQAKSSDTKLRTSAGFNIMKNKSFKNSSPQISFRQTSDNFYQTKIKFGQKQISQSRYNNYVIPVMDYGSFSEKRQNSLLSNSSLNQFQKIKKRSLNLISTTSTIFFNLKKGQNIKDDLLQTTRSFVPKMQSKSILFEKSQNSGKMQRQIIKSLIDKKLKKQIVKKTQQVLEKKCLTQRNEIKSIKKFFKIDSFSPTKKFFDSQVKKKSQKEITDELFNRMANIKDYPLLCKIESQRKRMESLSKKKLKQQKKIMQKRQQNKTGRNSKINGKEVIIVSNESPNVVNQPGNLFKPFSSQGSRMGTQQLV